MICIKATLVAITIAVVVVQQRNIIKECPPLPPPPPPPPPPPSPPLPPPPPPLPPQQPTPKNPYVSNAEFPHHVSIQINGKHHCSGSLISLRHVLTVAHCVADFEDVPDVVKVAVGTHRASGGMICDVSVIAVHEDYSINMLTSDIAVLHLRQTVWRKWGAIPIALPRERLGTVEKKMDVSTFGRTPSERSSAVGLKRFRIEIPPESNCEKWFPKRDLPGTFCGVVAADNVPCVSEGGEPAIMNKGQRYIVGMYFDTANQGCGRGIPDTFICVYEYLTSFIEPELSK